MLRSLDLFSGLGGITLGLEGICTPSVYCEIDPRCHAVLNARMEEGSLPRAPICPDIRSFTRDWLSSDIDIIVAGVPCTGFSVIGTRRAFDDPQSSLFFELLRVVDLVRPPAIFLENVPNILALGMDTMVREFVTQRNYCMSWCSLPASDVGAPHKRNRWYCIVFDPLFLPTLQSAIVGRIQTVHSWFSDAAESVDGADGVDARIPARLLTQLDVDERRSSNDRLMMLGNSVVPCAVRCAFDIVVGYRALDPTTTRRPVGQWPVCGLVSSDGSKRACENQRPSGRIKLLGLVVDPSLHAAGRRIVNPLLNTTPVLSKCRYLDRWTTPRTGGIGACNVLTERASHDLSSQVRFERGTDDSTRHGSLNPEFIEWMMGYPPNWTSTVRLGQARRL